MEGYVSGPIARIVHLLMVSQAHTATYYLSPTQTIRATAVRFKGLGRRRPTREEILITMGRPNYKARKFITLVRKAGVPFPIRKIQLDFGPAQRGGCASR